MSSQAVGAPTLLPAQVSPDEVREELRRILASDAFAGSERQSRFLRFIVERALQSPPDGLREYALGVEVFNRKPSFDPQTDPIVRVEASKLRHKLERFYETEGGGHAVVIELPKRRYVPLFHHRQPPESRAGHLRTWLSSPHRLTIGGLAAAILLLGAIGAYRELTRSARKATPSLGKPASIVVLPFADLSANKNQEYVGDWVTEELIEALSKLEGLRVISRTSSFFYKGKTEDIRKIGAQLNVGLALEGSVREVGHKLRIIAQIVDVADGYHVWSGTYEREMKDVAVVPEQIARSVADTLRVELAEPYRAGRPARYSRNPEATDLYMKGLHFAHQWAEDGLRKGLDHLEQAIQADPNFAPAYAELAECYSLLGAHAVLLPKQVMPKAKAVAEKALAIEPALAEAHASMGLVKALYDWDWAGAEQEFRRALELGPADADVYEAHVRAYLTPMGRLDEALREGQRAHSLDPVSPRIHSVLGLTYYHRGEYDQAIAQYQEALDLDPQFSAAHLALGSVYERKSMFGKAVAEFQKGRTTWTGGLGESLLGYTYARMGEKNEAHELLDKLEQLSGQRYVSGAHIALLYLGLGDKDQAMKWLEKAYEQRSASLVYLKMNPRWDSLRRDPRFIALLKKIRLE